MMTHNMKWRTSQSGSSTTWQYLHLFISLGKTSARIMINFSPKIDRHRGQRERDRTEEKYMNIEMKDFD